MEKIKFTKEEKKELKKALKVILDDLEELWKLSEQDSIYTYFQPTDYSRSIKFEIDDTGIKIYDSSYSREYLEKFGLVNTRPPIRDYTKIYYFLKNYEDIRRTFENEINRNRRNKGKGMTEITELRRKYEKEATIELDLPQTMNPHSISVKKEDGKTVGEIKMSYGTIKIATKGDIVLASKHEKAKTKIKM